MERKSVIKRETNETKINLELSLLKQGQSEINTGIPFFDHMLSHVAKHGSNLIKIEAKGDIEIDFHHTVEDIGIVFGRAIKEALGDKKGINRYGYASIPMDETLADVSLDICDRSVFVYNVTFKNSKIGDFDTELVKEFFAALSQSSGMTLHINVPYGENDHHIAEAVFKSFAKALKSAVSFSGDNTIPSTKGVL
jgi:imidazoleglycerol-phosphate dehydratase